MDFNELMATAQMNTVQSKRQVERIHSKQKEQRKLEDEKEKRRQLTKTLQKTVPQYSKLPNCPSTESGNKKSSKDGASSVGHEDRPIAKPHTSKPFKQITGSSLQSKSGKASRVPAIKGEQSKLENGRHKKQYKKLDEKLVAKSHPKKAHPTTNSKVPAKLKHKPTSSVTKQSECPHHSVKNGPVGFNELMKMASNLNEENKKRPVSKPQPKQSDDSQVVPSLAPKGHDTKSGAHSKKDPAEKKLDKSKTCPQRVQQGIQNKHTKGGRPSTSKSHSSSLRPKEMSSPKHKEVTPQKGPSSVKRPMESSQKGKVPPNPVTLKSFYNTKLGGSAASKADCPLSGSWLETLGYSMNEIMKRKRQRQEDYEEESDSYEEDDDGFVVDGDDAEVDVSGAIRELFGYDKRRYVNERNDDMAMESSYSQQQFEERRSARIGKQEDEEDMKKEMAKLKRKATKQKSKKSKKSRQEKSFF